jgi:hypothetical protein
MNRILILFFFVASVTEAATTETQCTAIQASIKSGLMTSKEWSVSITDFQKHIQSMQTTITQRKSLLPGHFIQSLKIQTSVLAAKANSITDEEVQNRLSILKATLSARPVKLAVVVNTLAAAQKDLKTLSKCALSN